MVIGNGPDALTRVSMIGNDLSLDPVSAPAARTPGSAGRGGSADVTHRRMTVAEPAKRRKQRSADPHASSFA